jgi:hypothetical protein
VKAAAQLTNLPAKLLWRICREGIICNPVADMDLRGLAMVGQIWRREWFLRMALSEFSQTRREELIRKPELTRVERYMLTCYLNAKEGERIQTSNIIALVEHYLNARVSAKQVHPIRALAYEIRRGRRLNPQGGVSLSGKQTPGFWRSLYGFSGNPTINKGGYSLWVSWTVIRLSFACR